MYNAWLAPIRDQLPSDLLPADFESLSQAITQEALSRFGNFLAGIQNYQESAVVRPVSSDVQLLWRAGTTRLLDYAPDASGPVLLVIPSLVNRFEILDLDGDHSFLRFMAAEGYRPLVVDWGSPGEEEKTFGFDEYLTRRLVPVLEHIDGLASGKQIHMLGYCMGGLLALALALHKPERISSLALMAAPWDFAAKGVGGVPAADTTVGSFFLQQAKSWLPNLEPIGILPTAFLQAVFTGFQPLHVLQKFSRMATPPADEKLARRFVLTEDWLNNGVPLSLPVAKECLENWYEKNATARLDWRVAGRLIDPSQLSMPSYVVVPCHDKVVPPESAKPLAALIKGVTLHEPDTGHLGLMASENAPEKIWKPYVQWLKQQKK